MKITRGKNGEVRFKATSAADREALMKSLQSGNVNPLAIIEQIAEAKRLPPVPKPDADRA